MQDHEFSAYNHTMQARVEGAIGYVKQHSRVSMLAVNVPTRWCPQATTDFVAKKTSFGTRPMHHVRPQQPTNACSLHSQIREPLLLFLSGVE